MGFPNSHSGIKKDTNKNKDPRIKGFLLFKRNSNNSDAKKILKEIK